MAIKLALTLLLGVMLGFFANAIRSDRASRGLEKRLEAISESLAQLPRESASPVRAGASPEQHYLAEQFEELKTEVREVIARGAPAATNTSERRAAPPPTIEETRAVTDGRAVLAQAVQSGRWTDNERNTFRHLVGEMAPAHRKDLLLQLARALNSQQVVVDTTGPPF